MTVMPAPLASRSIVRPLGVPTLHWRFSESCPPEWWTRLERCGGGFFHTPAAVEEEQDPPFYAELEWNDQVVGLAAGWWRRCRLSLRRRHVQLASVPALVGGAGGRHVALETLIGQLRSAGAAEVAMDSYDGGWIPPDGDDRTRGAARLEYRLALDAGPDELLARCNTHHRRVIRRAERRDWRFAVIEQRLAPAVIAEVQSHAGQRAAHRGTPFSVDTIPRPSGLDDSPMWGTVAFGAWDGDHLLSAALVGWGGHRAVYLRGGSTPDGYRANSAVWLHWRIMQSLLERGFVEYSLGGAPASARQPDDPSHGLHRFKQAFGVTTVECRGARWDLVPAHRKAHDLCHWMRRTAHVM